MLLFQVVMDMENKSSVTAYPIFGFYSIFVLRKTLI